jgi:uncharacterized membrane protein
MWAPRGEDVGVVVFGGDDVVGQGSQRDIGKPMLEVLKVRKHRFDVDD